MTGFRLANRFSLRSPGNFRLTGFSIVIEPDRYLGTFFFPSGKPSVLFAKGEAELAKPRVS